MVGIVDVWWRRHPTEPATERGVLFVWVSDRPYPQVSITKAWGGPFRTLEEAWAFLGESTQEDDWDGETAELWPVYDLIKALEGDGVND